MRVRTQLALALSLLAGFTAAVIVAVSFLGSREILFRQIQSQALSIAATAAGAIDVEAHERIRTSADEAGADYGLVQKQLRAIRDANRRDDVHVRFVYTMRPQDHGPWIYVVDAESAGEDHSPFGTPVEFENGEALHLDRPYVEKAFSKDEFGTWLSANAPIVNAAGRPVGLLGVDFAASEVLNRLNHLLIAGLVAGGVALAAGILLAFLLAPRLTAPLDRIAAGIRQIGDGRLDTRVEVHRGDEFGMLGRAVNEMAVALRERDALKGAVVRYMSQELADQILADQSAPTLRGARRQVTVLIVDIRNFTAMSAALAPEDVVAFLNRFFSCMIDAIFSQRGTLDKFLGDGCLAIFGAPIDDPEHQRMAVLAAQGMLRSVHELGVEMREQHGIELRIGIALHTGEAIVGNIGSELRMEYTAVGDTVNVASRLEVMNKEYCTEFLASEAVVRGAGEEFRFREVAEVTPRGAGRSLKIYTFAD
jgi:adenylate cyclase